MGAEAWADVPSVFHSGEQEVQRIAGVRDMCEKLGRSWHSPTVPAANIPFLKKRCLIYLSCLDKEQQLWASVLYGLPGFINADDPQHVVMQPAHRLEADPSQFATGSLLGTYCIDLATRQRCRQNGRVASADGDTVVMDVDVAFGSCPKFIQARHISIKPEDLEAHVNCSEPREAHRGGAELGQAERDMICRMDTMHLASCYVGSAAEGGSSGCDISHRGGPTGFVQIEGEGTLLWADYIGNYTFTSLGNLHVDKRAGILFLDYHTGDTLQLTGECQIRWDEHALPGAERTLCFITKAWVRVERAVPCSVEGAVGWSPYNPAPTWAFSTGTSQDRKLQLQNNYITKDKSKTYLRCLDRVQEAPDVHTYWFEYQPSSRAKVMADYKPGQYGSFEMEGLGEGNQKDIMRTWTISTPPDDAVARNAFGLTIKKIGLASSWLAENMEAGRVIAFKGFDGVFTPSDCCGDSGVPEAGVLLLAGGIGVTPLRAMLPDFLASKRPVTLLYSVREVQDAAFLSEFAETVKGSGSNLDLHLFVTSKRDLHQSSVPHGVNLQSGRISAAAIHKVMNDHHIQTLIRLGSKSWAIVPGLKERAAFLCGPTEMMASLSSALESLDFPMANLHQESFNF